MLVAMFLILRIKQYHVEVCAHDLLRFIVKLLYSPVPVS